MSGRGGTRRKGGGQGGASVRQKKAHKKERQLGRDEYLIVSHDSSDATKASAVSRGIISYLFGYVQPRGRCDSFYPYHVLPGMQIGLPGDA